MRIARFRDVGGARVGIVTGTALRPLVPSVTTHELLAADVEERERIVARSRDGGLRPWAEVELLAPVEPPTLRDFLTFEEHLEGSLRILGAEAPPPAWFDQPLFYFSNSSAVVGPNAEVAIPPGCRLLDFELELAAVIGRPGRDLTPAEAGAHIAGYTIFNDWSARDLMAPVIPVGMGPVKGKDFANTLGPWIVTADELEPFRVGDRLNLRMHAEVNGRPLPAGGDTSANMSWSFEELVAFASRGATVTTGEVLGSGTCGAGSLLEYWAHSGTEYPPPLAPGDRVVLVVEGIGEVSNTVVEGVGPVSIPRARVGMPRPPRSWKVEAR